MHEDVAKEAKQIAERSCSVFFAALTLFLRLKLLFGGHDAPVSKET
jgi:hypothetical protein